MHPVLKYSFLILVLNSLGGPLFLFSSDSPLSVIVSQVSAPPFSTIMTFINRDTATVEVPLTLVTLNAKHRRTLRCRNTPAQRRLHSVHSAAVGHCTLILPTEQRTVKIITIIHFFQSLLFSRHSISKLCSVSA